MARPSPPSSALGWSKLVLLTTLLACAQDVCAAPRNGGHGHVKAGQSIQDAINKARRGDEIHVDAGTYAEQLTIETDGIALIGHGAIIVPPNATDHDNICTGLAGNGTQAGICVAGSEVVLAPYEFEHRRIVSVGRPVREVSITGFEVRGFSGLNIAVVGAKDTEILKNTLVNGDQYGFLTVGSLNTLAKGNNVTSDYLRYIGMCMDDVADAEFLENDVSGYYIGLCLQTKGAQVRKNRVSNTCVGAFLDPGVEGVRIIENHVSASNPECPGDGVRGGINIDGGKDILVLRNLVEGQRNHNASAGIVLVDDFFTPAQVVSSEVIIKKNTLRDNDFDIFNNSTGPGNVVENNFCSNSGCA